VFGTLLPLPIALELLDGLFIVLQMAVLRLSVHFNLTRRHDLQWRVIAWASSRGETIRYTPPSNGIGAATCCVGFSRIFLPPRSVGWGSLACGWEWEPAV